MQLTTLISNWDKDINILVTQTRKSKEEPDFFQAKNLLEESSVLLAIRLIAANIGDLD